jgi:hypothetical protein
MSEWNLWTYGRDQVGKHLSDMLAIRYGLKQGDAF